MDTITFSNFEDVLATQEADLATAANLRAALDTTEAKLRVRDQLMMAFLRRSLSAELPKAVARLRALHGNPDKDNAWRIHCPPFRAHPIKCALYISTRGMLLEYNNGLVGSLSRRLDPFDEFHTNDPRQLFAALQLVMSAGVKMAA